MSVGGRAGRQVQRTRSREAIGSLVLQKARQMTPWLLKGDGELPFDGQVQIKSLRRELGAEARNGEEAALFSGALHDFVDGWNISHPNQRLKMPSAVRLLGVRAPAFTENSLDHLRLARGVHEAFESRLAEFDWGHAEPGGLEAVALVVGSALFDSGCVAIGDLCLFASWLSDPSGVLYKAPDLPPWVDLKRRKALRRASGEDKQGVYGLRRLFLAPRTLDLIARYDRIPRKVGGKSKQEVKKGKIGEMLLGQDYSSSVLRDLLKGASLVMEARPNGPDHTMVKLASRRMENFAADEKSWKRLVKGGVLPDERTQRISTEGLIMGETRRTGPTKGQDAAFDQLHFSLSTVRPEGDDLITTKVKLTVEVVTKRLNDLPFDAETASCLHLLRDWYLSLLSEKKKVSTVQRYHSSVGPLLYAMVGTSDLKSALSNELEELYLTIMEEDHRSDREQCNLRQGLGRLHRFAVSDERWQLPEIEENLLAGKSVIPKVSSTLLGRRDIDRARALLRREFGESSGIGRAVNAAMLAMSRGGLRVGEASKAMLEHYEPCVGTGEDDQVLFVRPSMFGNNKTRGSYRQVPLLKMMTREEQKEFKAFLAFRRQLSSKGPLFGVICDDGTLAALDGRRLSEVIGEALRQVTGLDHATSHALRRAAASGLFLAIHETHFEKKRHSGFIERFTGWTVKDRKRVAECVAPKLQARDRWQSLARFLGHGGAEMSFECYVMVADLAVYDAWALDEGKWTEGHQKDLAHRVEYLWPARQYNERELSKGPVGKGDDTPARLLLALNKVDEALKVGDAERIAELSTGFLKRRLMVAEGWRGLKSNGPKSKARLQPDNRARCLAPCPVKGKKKSEEALKLAEDLVLLAQNDESKTAVKRWIRLVLQGATQTNSGVRFRSENGFEAWYETALLLRKESRWHVEKELKGTGYASGKPWNSYRVRLLSDDKNNSFLSQNQNGQRPKGKSSDCWHSCVRFAAHLAAIYLKIEPYGRRAEPKERGKVTTGSQS